MPRTRAHRGRERPRRALWGTNAVTGVTMSSRVRPCDTQKALFGCGWAIDYGGRPLRWQLGEAALSRLRQSVEARIRPANGSALRRPGYGPVRVQYRWRAPRGFTSGLTTTRPSEHGGFVVLSRSPPPGGANVLRAGASARDRLGHPRADVLRHTRDDPLFKRRLYLRHEFQHGIPIGAQRSSEARTTARPRCVKPGCHTLLPRAASRLHSVFAHGELKLTQSLTSLWQAVRRNDLHGWEYLPAARLGWKAR